MRRTITIGGVGWTLGGALLGCVLLPRAAGAHGRLVYPAARSPDTGLMSAPCGDVPPGTDRTSFGSGDTVTVSWTLEVNHGGTLRVAFSPAGDEGFDQGVVADGIPDADGTTEGQVDITLPDCRCTDCSIQLRQILPSGNAAYYSCADIELVAANPDTTPECELASGTGGSGTGPYGTSSGASSDGSSSTSGMSSGGSAGSEGTGDSDGALPDPPPASGGCTIHDEGRAPGLLPLLLLGTRRRRRAGLAGLIGLAVALGGCWDPGVPFQDVDRDTAEPTSAGSTGGSGSTSGSSTTASTSGASTTTTGSTSTSTTGSTTVIPECGGLGGTGNSTGAGGPWLELTHEDALLTDGSVIGMICGAQGGTMFVLEAWFGGFEPTAYSVPMTLDVEMPGFPSGPAGNFYHEERPMDLNCTASEPDGVLVLILPPDRITDPYTLQGATATVTMSIETPDGPASFDADVTVSVPADLWCL